MPPFKLAALSLAPRLAATLLAVAGSAVSSPGAAVALDAPPPATKAASARAIWLTDFAAAQQKARAGRKPLFLDFTGSDWCGWCIKLDNEIFATAEFGRFAEKHLVLVKVDFPLRHPQPGAEKLQNEQLAARFQVLGYPTLILLSPDGSELGRLGYLPGGPKPFLDRLGELLAASAPLQKAPNR